MVARVTKEASTTSGGISVPLRPMMGVKISNTTQMRNMKCTYGNARPSRYSTQYFADAPGEKKKSLSGITEPETHTHTLDSRSCPQIHLKEKSVYTVFKV